MLEVFLLVALYMFLKKMLINKNRPGGLAILGPGAVLVGEIAGAIVARRSGHDSFGLLYLHAIGGGLLGAALIAYIVFRLPPLPIPCPACGCRFLPEERGTHFNTECPSCRAALRVSAREICVRQPRKDRPVEIPEVDPRACPACLSEPGLEGSAACFVCLKRHHEECWDKSGVCGACGAGKRYTDLVRGGGGSEAIAQA